MSLARTLVAAALICGTLLPAAAQADYRVTCVRIAGGIECSARSIYRAPRRENIAYAIRRPAEPDPYIAERAGNFCGRGYRMTAGGCELGTR